MLVYWAESEMKVHDPQLYLYVNNSLKSKHKVKWKQAETEEQALHSATLEI